MKVVILHGTKGSPEGNWYSWLADQLQERGFENTAPKLPTPEHQSLSSWLAAFQAQCGPISPDTILIGHSCGAVLILRLLEKSRVAAACTVLVAPPAGAIGIPEYDALNASFLQQPFDWTRIVSNAGRLAYFMGDDDPYVPQVQLRAIADELNVDPMVIEAGGHLNAESGYRTFPQLLAQLDEFRREGSIRPRSQ